MQYERIFDISIPGDTKSNGTVPVITNVFIVFKEITQHRSMNYYLLNVWALFH